MDLAAWWRALNDEELNSLVDRAVKSNLDLEIALDRLQQARTYEAVVVGHALPEVDASAAAGRGTGSDLTKGRADTALRSADNGSGLQHINTIAGFDAVDQPLFDQELERAIDRRRLGTAAVGPQGFQNLVSADRRMALPDQLQDPPANVGQPCAAFTAQRLRRAQSFSDAMVVIMG